MYLSAQEIANSRDHALNNLLGWSTSCLHAGHRLSELLGSASRDSVQHTSKHWSALAHGQLESLTQFPAALWLDSLARNSQLLDSIYAIIGDTHKAMIRNAEAQVRVFDEIVFASIRRAEKSSPWEAGIALGALRSTLESAEKTLQGMSTAAIQSVELAESEVHQISESISESTPPTKRATTRQARQNNS